MASGIMPLPLPKKLRAKFGWNTLFATFQTSSAVNAAGFEVVPLESLMSDAARKYEHTLLHYVNYGFQKRGIPFRLLSILRGLRRQHHGKLVTIFHELYASGPPWSERVLVAAVANPSSQVGRPFIGRVHCEQR